MQLSPQPPVALPAASHRCSARATLCHRQPIYKHLSPENSPLGMKTPFRGAKLAMRITTAYHDATTILRCDRNSKGHIGFHPAVMRQALP